MQRENRNCFLVIKLVQSVHVLCGSLLFHHLPSIVYLALCIHVSPCSNPEMTSVQVLLLFEECHLKRPIYYLKSSSVCSHHCFFPLLHCWMKRTLLTGHDNECKSKVAVSQWDASCVRFFPSIGESFMCSLSCYQWHISSACWHINQLWAEQHAYQWKASGAVEGFQEDRIRYNSRKSCVINSVYTTFNAVA